MDVVAEMLLHHLAIDKYTDDAWPHVDKVQTVKTVGNNKHISGEGGGIDSDNTEIYKDICGNSADGSIEECASKTAEGEIIRNELGRGGEDGEKIVPKIILACNKHCDWRGNKKNKTQINCVKIYDLVGVFSVMLAGVISGNVLSVSFVTKHRWKMSFP